MDSKLSITLEDGTVKESSRGFICLIDGDNVQVYFRNLGTAEALLSLNQMIAHVVNLDADLKVNAMPTEISGNNENTPH